MPKTPGEPYTIDLAIADAKELLTTEFGEADQQATVQLATFLYGAHERDEFMRRREGDTAPYGSPGQTT